MVQYRRFRNNDPPRIVEVWNETFSSRGSVRLRNSSPLDRYVLAKPYFDPAGLILAEEDGACVGFAHAGFGPNAEGSALDMTTGVIAVLGVRSGHRQKGIGAGLVEQCERYVKERGASAIVAGAKYPCDPFYFGLYGGSEGAGFLATDVAAQGFFEDRGYKLSQRALILQRSLKEPSKIFDPRFNNIRTRFDLRLMTRKKMDNWWQECIFGAVEPLDFYLEEKTTNHRVAHSLLWEMEGFCVRWNQPAVGIVDFKVEPEFRRQGLGKYYLTQLLRHLQEQFFEVAETHVDEGNTAGLAFCTNLGFKQVDVGNVYRKEL